MFAGPEAPVLEDVVAPECIFGVCSCDTGYRFDGSNCVLEPKGKGEKQKYLNMLRYLKVLITSGLYNLLKKQVYSTALWFQLPVTFSRV